MPNFRMSLMAVRRTGYSLWANSTKWLRMFKTTLSDSLISITHHFLSSDTERPWWLSLYVIYLIGSLMYMTPQLFLYPSESGVIPRSPLDSAVPLEATALTLQATSFHLRLPLSHPLIMLCSLSCLPFLWPLCGLRMAPCLRLNVCVPPTFIH